MNMWYWKKAEIRLPYLGIENWSAKARFPKYGDLKKAYEGAEAYPFKILMSHDPSHWEAEVRKSYPDIDLMLAGHTHGMQFGVEIPGLNGALFNMYMKNGPVCTKKAAQKLYVNRGFGFIGYPGRVGILPKSLFLSFPDRNFFLFNPNSK